MTHFAGLLAPFAGNSSESPPMEWKLKWELWLRTASKLDGSDDPFIFGSLVKVLDDGEVAHINQLLSKDPNLSYKTYWQGLVAQQERFNSGNLRQSLENLKLDSRGKMTFSRCKEYTSNFQRLCDSLSGLSHEEAFRILIRQVPHYLAQKLQTFYSKKRDTFKVKISGLSTVSAPDLQNFLASTLTFLPKDIRKEGDVFIVEVSSADHHGKVLSLDRKTIANHGQILVESVCNTIPISECLNFLNTTVETDEELEESRRGLSFQNNPSRAYGVGSQKGNKDKSSKNESAQVPSQPKSESSPSPLSPLPHLR
jgi:hypothetical protein